VRLLLDTHTFLWFIGGNPKLSGHARQLIGDVGNERLLSIASLWEMSIKAGIGKLRGRTEKIERLRDGLAAVSAEHSTDGRRIFADREGGEAMPKRPVAGKVRPGMTEPREVH